MRWVTREHVHFDRVASPWLIKRFIDPDAEFLFVPWGKESERPSDAIPYAIPGVELGSHDSSGTTFHKILVKYGKGDDPVLVSIDRIVEIGVENALHNVEPSHDRCGELALGVMALSDGMLLLSKDDHEQLERSFPLYDALYAALQMERLMKDRGDDLPRGKAGATLWRAVFGTAIVTVLRPRGKTFSSAAIADLTNEVEAELRRLQANLT